MALLPPFPGDWGKVKSDNKMLTAWACGLPISTGEYYELRNLLLEPELREAAKNNNNQLALASDFDVKHSAGEWRVLTNTQPGATIPLDGNVIADTGRSGGNGVSIHAD